MWPTFGAVLRGSATEPRADVPSAGGGALPGGRDHAASRPPPIRSADSRIEHVDVGRIHRSPHGHPCGESECGELPDRNDRRGPDGTLETGPGQVTETLDVTMTVLHDAGVLAVRIGRWLDRQVHIRRHHDGPTRPVSGVGQLEGGAASNVTVVPSACPKAGCVP